MIDALWKKMLKAAAFAIHRSEKQKEEELQLADCVNTREK